jgi:hypothetical protein
MVIVFPSKPTGLRATIASLSSGELNFMTLTPRGEAGSWNAGSPQAYSMARRTNR